MDSTTLIAIKELGDGLGDGETRRAVCPWCDGGEVNRGQRSFVVRGTATGIAYRCYRATCSAFHPSAGHIGDAGVVASRGFTDDPKKSTYISPYRGELEPLPKWMIELLYDKFELQPHELTAAGFKWAPEEERVYMPVYGPSGGLRGAQLRSYDPDANPKTLAHPEKATPWQAFYRLGEGRPTGPISHPNILLVLEDQVSALKASRHFNTVALLGTRLTDDKLEELSAIGARNTLFGMDGDATGKAIDMVRQNMLLFESTGVVLLGRDFKDVPDAEIIERVRAAL